MPGWHICLILVPWHLDLQDTPSGGSMNAISIPFIDFAMRNFKFCSLRHCGLKKASRQGAKFGTCIAQGFRGGLIVN